MVLRRLFKKARRARQPRRRHLRLERLASRELFAVDPLGVITGSVFTDLAADGTINSIVDASGATVNDPTHNGVDIELYRDNNGDGVIDAGDTLVDTATTSGSGDFRFEGLAAGNYLLSQEAIAGLVAPTDPAAVTVSDDDGQLLTGIDDFSEAFQLLTVADASDPDESDSAGGGTATSILGGERDLLLANNGGSDQAELEVDGELKFSSQLGVTATALVQYDGVDGSSTLDATGLGGVDLTDSNQGAGLLLGAFADLAGGTLTVRVFTDANNASETTIAIPAAATIEELFIPFSDFATLGGATGPADFTNVGAIEGFVEGVAGMDARVSVISSIAPVEMTQNLANIESVSLGDTVFRDNNDNGVRDADEPGIAGADLNLYIDTNANGTFDAGTDTLADTTTSGVDGAFLFEGLTPGDYIVQIPASEFVLGQPLFGFGTSQAVTADPNDNIDDDNNGAELSGQGVVSQAITLISQGEPTDDGDADPSTNRTLDFGFVPEIDLVVEKQLTTADPIAGGEANFEITVTNNGPLEATNVVLVDPLPAGLTFDRIENLPSGISTSVSGNQLTVDIGTLASGASNAVTFNVIAIIANGSSGETFTNEATVTADERDTDASNDGDAAVITTIGSVVDLAVSKTGNLANGTPGQSLTYTLTATNSGPSDATEVEVVDTLPVNFTLVSANANGIPFTNADGVITFVVGDLPSGDSVSVTLTGTIDTAATGTLVNSVAISGNEADSDTSNDTASVTTPLTPQFDLSIDKTASADDATPGANLTYQISLDNAGPSDATNVVVTDVLPDGVTFVSGSIGGVAATVDGSTVTFALGTLEAGEGTAGTLVVRVNSTTTGTLTNQATVSADAGDTDATNDADTVTSTLAPSVDLTVEKDVSDSSATAGSEVTYTIIVSNEGPSAAAGVTAVDTLPTGVTFVSGTGPDGQALSANGQTVNVTIGTLDASATAQFTITAMINANVTQDLTNSVTVATTLTESDTSNNSASATTVLDRESASIEGAVYIDDDNDGVRDAGESPLAGVTLNLTGTDSQGDSVSATTTTDANGVYQFTSLSAGTYRIDQVQPATDQNGLLISNGRLTAGQNATATTEENAFSEIVLGANIEATGFHFGEVPLPLSIRYLMSQNYPFLDQRQ